MGYALIPFIVIGFVASLIGTVSTRYQAIAGSSVIADAAAEVRANQAEAFAHACLSAATTAGNRTGILDPSAWLNGIAAVQGAQCIALTDGDGRLVYSSTPTAPGAAGVLMYALERSALWYTVDQLGVARSMASGQAVSIPSNIPVASLLYRVRVSP